MTVKPLFSVPFQLAGCQKANHPLVRIRSDQDRVEKGFFCTPQLGLRHLQKARLSAGYSFLSLVNIHRYVAVLSRLYVHPHFCGLDLNRFHMYLRNVILLPDEQMHRPINPGAGIPAAIRLQRIVHLLPGCCFLLIPQNQKYLHQRRYIHTDGNRRAFRLHRPYSSDRRPQSAAPRIFQAWQRPVQRSFHMHTCRRGK